MGDRRRKLWAEDVVSLSFANPYLLYAILAISALHMFVLDPTRKDIRLRANLYHTNALRLMQPVLANMTKDHSMAMFAAPMLLSAYASADAALGHQQTCRFADPIDDILTCFQLGRGINAVLIPFAEHLLGTNLAPLIVFTDVEDKGAIETAQLKLSHLQSVRDLANRIAGEKTKLVYTPAIDNLIRYTAILSTTDRDHDSLRYLSSWPFELDPQFYNLVRSHDPIALIVLAYYAVMVTMRPDAWWMCEWPRLLMARIDELLGLEWEYLLRWPRQVIRGKRSMIEDYHLDGGP